MTEIAETPLPDMCFRCGYDLRATADDSVCPECELAVVISRRENEKLRHTTPQWWRALTRGTGLIFLTILGGGIWLPLSIVLARMLARLFPGAMEYEWEPVVLACYALLALVMLIGVLLVTRPQGYEPIDRAHHVWRTCLRISTAVPMLAVLFAIVYLLAPDPRYQLLSAVGVNPNWFENTALYLATLGIAPLPILLFLHLRRLVGRARRERLSLDCIIVGVGSSATLLLLAAIFFYRDTHSNYAIFDNAILLQAMALAVPISIILFFVWDLYVLIKVSIAFIAAERALRRAQREYAVLPGAAEVRPIP
jgi:hypothetical protein